MFRKECHSLGRRPPPSPVTARNSTEVSCTLFSSTYLPFVDLFAGKNILFEKATAFSKIHPPPEIIYVWHSPETLQKERVFSSYYLIMDVVAAAVVEVKEGKKKIHYHVGSCKSRMVKCTAFGYSRDKHGGCYDLSTGTPCVDDFDVTPMESIVGHIQVRRQIKRQNKKKKVVLQLQLLRTKKLLLIFVQDHFHMPSLVAYDSPELLESSSRRVQTDRPVLNAARNQTTNHAHGTNGERSSSVHTEGRDCLLCKKNEDTKDS
nr:hypothetical protein [Tanacetum cinerariifolium]